MNDVNINAPLAERMRPHELSDYVGQSHILSAGKPLQIALTSGRLHSMIFGARREREKPRWHG